MSQIKAVLPVLLIPKTMNVMIGYKLHHFEFACKCTHDECTFTILSQELISGWNAMRRAVDKSLLVNSGFRCQKHNSEPFIKGVPTSRHKSGHAIDVYTGRLNEIEKATVTKIARDHFDIVVEYSTFLHCHMEPDTHNRIFVGQSI